jgi:hypothetical protein
MALTRQDVGYLSVLVWAFIGIAVKQTPAPMVVLSAWIAAILMLGLMILTWMRRRTTTFLMHLFSQSCSIRWTMQSKPDPRLPELTQGPGVIVDGRAKYYPLSAIPLNGLEDRWLNHTLRVQRSQMDSVPHAFWNNTSDEPMQLLTRWYGFSFTYPNCEIYTSLHS